MSCCYLGYNCIVFEHFTTSIGDLMVANWVYWRRVSGASKQIFSINKSIIDAVKFSNTIQLSPKYILSLICFVRIDFWEQSIWHWRWSLRYELRCPFQAQHFNNSTWNFITDLARSQYNVTLEISHYMFISRLFLDTGNRYYDV